MRVDSAATMTMMIRSFIWALNRLVADERAWPGQSPAFIPGIFPRGRAKSAFKLTNDRIRPSDSLLDSHRPLPFPPPVLTSDMDETRVRCRTRRRCQLAAQQLLIADRRLLLWRNEHSPVAAKSPSNGGQINWVPQVARQCQGPSAGNIDVAVCLLDQ